MRGQSSRHMGPDFACSIRATIRHSFFEMPQPPAVSALVETPLPAAVSALVKTSQPIAFAHWLTPCSHSSVGRESKLRRRSGSRAAATCCTTTRTRMPASGERAPALRRELPEGRRRDRPGIYRRRATRGTLAGSLQDRRHVRAHGRLRPSPH